MRALIIGGGIGGLATAIALRRTGWEVAIYERAPELLEVGAGLILWQRGGLAPPAGLAQPSCAPRPARCAWPT